MAIGSIKITLRPLRMAFLVRPTDDAAVKKAIQAASFLWGGAFDPIIPVYQKLPKQWEQDGRGGFTASSALQGYLDAFDPDFIVKVGGLEKETLTFPHREVLNCTEIMSTIEEYGTPKFGIGLTEILRHFVDTELKFVRHAPLSIRIPKFGSGYELFFSSVFGALPDSLESISEQWWKQLPGVEIKQCTLENYCEFLSQDNLFIRRLGTFNIRTYRARSFRRRDCIFLMNAERTMDILDYWNLRALGWNVLPVCKQAVDSVELKRTTAEFVEENSFPFRGNPNLFNDTMLLKSRSLTISDVEKFGRSLNLSPRSHPHENKIVYHFSYPRIWDDWAREKDQAEPCELTAGETEQRIDVRNESITFQSLMPEFADRFAGHSRPRCANDIELRIWNDEALVAEVVPEGDWRLAKAAGAFDHTAWRCGKSGLVHLPRFKDWTERLNTASAESVFSAWLSARGWSTEFSNNGHIARQMLKHLQGIYGINILAKRSVIELFEKFAIGLPKSKAFNRPSQDQNDLAQEESGRTMHADSFKDALKKIAREHKHNLTNPDDLARQFVKRHMVQLGLKIQCPECRQRSWFSLKDVDYELKCPQCLARFKVPEHAPKEMSWTYRAFGPFSLPFQAHGAYSVLLTLRFFAGLLDGATTPILSFKATKATNSLEADLGMFFQKSKLSPSRVEVIFAECKTFGRFEAADAARMLALSNEFPGAVLVFATLNPSLSSGEKRLLRPVVNRGRRYWKSERPRNPVLILTGNELFANEEPRQVWRELGGIYSAHASSGHADRDLICLADDLQQIYLGMKPWQESVAASSMAARARQVSRHGVIIQQPPSATGAPNLDPRDGISVSFPVAVRQVPWR